MWKTQWIKWKTQLHNAIMKPNYVNKTDVYLGEYSSIRGINPFVKLHNTTFKNFDFKDSKNK